MQMEKIKHVTSSIYSLLFVAWKESRGLIMGNLVIDMLQCVSNVEPTVQWRFIKQTNKKQCIGWAAGGFVHGRVDYLHAWLQRGRQEFGPVKLQQERRERPSFTSESKGPPQTKRLLSMHTWSAQNAWCFRSAGRMNIH